MKKIFRLVFFVFGVSCLSGVGSAAVIHDLKIEYHSGRYELVSHTYVDAPREAIFHVLTDYDHFNRISRIYEESGFMEPASDGTPVVYTRMRGCVLFFCKNITRVERLETREPGFIHTVTLPEQSDFRYSVSEWILEPEGNGTNLIYRAVLEPDFWLPPIIGPWVLKKRLLEGGTGAINRIESLSQERSASSQVQGAGPDSVTH
ncbi:MAG: SRPBCC family protein [Pseudomonadota bacterium]|nr:SRPBCC family protein [Pseudomonadota bacterium]